jgi:hypothetical protein
VGGFYLLIAFLAVVGGGAVAVLAYAVGRVVDPNAEKFPLAYVIPVGMVLGGTLGIATVSLGVTMLGDTSTDGVITISVTSLIAVAFAAGIIAGGPIGPIVDLLASPAALGPRNEATPVSAKAFWSDVMGAVGVPMLAIVIVATLAIGLSQILLNTHSTALAVTIFAIAGALILGGTTLLALRPWDHRSQQG